MADQEGTVAAAARGRRDHRRPHERAAVVGRLPERKSGFRPHRQPLGHGTYPGRLERRSSSGTRRQYDATLTWYFDALERRDGFISTWQDFFEDFDGLVMPPALTSAFNHRETGAPPEVDGETVNYWWLARLLTVFNLTGLPALVVPAGVDDGGLPIAIQIVGLR